MALYAKKYCSLNFFCTTKKKKGKYLSFKVWFPSGPGHGSQMAFL